MNKARFKILASAIIFSVFVSPTLAGDVEISVSESALITPPDTLVGQYGPRFLLFFSLPSLLDGEEITFAEVTTAGYFPSGGNDAPLTFETYSLTSSWGAGASWSTPWRSPGGDYDLDGQQISIVKTGGQHSVFIDVTHVVKRWAAGKASNHGLILIPVRMNGDAYTQFSDPGGSFRSQAKLKVYY